MRVFSTFFTYTKSVRINHFTTKQNGPMNMNKTKNMISNCSVYVPIFATHKSSDASADTTHRISVC